ncbi:MAG: NnrS family protein [Burkholderiaceae bacterium]|nr:NnrS family protein [Burkholderiaceae bacterium]
MSRFTAMQFIPLEEVRRPTLAPGAWALWALGFRPFYLAASAFAALSVALWALQFGGLSVGLRLPGPLWHAHEMVFGYTLAVVVGFLFTAGRNWSGQPTPTGRPLQALLLLWLAGRLGVFALGAWPDLALLGWAVMALNVAFPVAAGLALWRTLRAGANRRNDFFPLVLGAIALAQAAFHLAERGLLPGLGRGGVQLALDAVLFVMAVMGGRVIPMFTHNGVPGSDPQRHPWVERLALGGVLALWAADALAGVLLPLAGWPDPARWAAGAAGLLALLAAAAHAWRWALWQPWATRRVPLVWVLHLAYLWIPLHLLLRAVAEAGGLPPSVATHALTVGAIGGLTIGMMVRTARGHTARPLQADRWEVAAFALVALAALLRVGLPLLWPATLLEAVWSSALLWALGMGLYAWRYTPILTRARLDGRPG